MNFCLLVEEDQLHEARQRFPLFYDTCLRELPDPADGERHAVVCDEENSVLAVLRHAHPYRGQVITLVALVARTERGVQRLLAFLRRLLTECRDLDLPGILAPAHAPTPEIGGWGGGRKDYGGGACASGRQPPGVPAPAGWSQRGDGYGRLPPVLPQQSVTASSPGRARKGTKGTLSGRMPDSRRAP